MTYSIISTELSVERGCDLGIVKTLHRSQRVSFQGNRLEKREIYRLAPPQRLRCATTVFTAASVLFLTCIVVNADSSTSHLPLIHAIQRQRFCARKGLRSQSHPLKRGQLYFAFPKQPNGSIPNA